MGQGIRVVVAHHIIWHHILGYLGWGEVEYALRFGRLELKKGEREG